MHSAQVSYENEVHRKVVTETAFVGVAHVGSKRIPGEVAFLLTKVRLVEHFCTKVAVAVARRRHAPLAYQYLIEKVPVVALG